MIKKTRFPLLSFSFILLINVSNSHCIKKYDFKKNLSTVLERTKKEFRFFKKNIQIRNKAVKLASKKTFKKNLEKNCIIIPTLVYKKDEQFEIEIEKFEILEKNPKMKTVEVEELLRYLHINKTPQTEDPLGFPQQQFIPLSLQKKQIIPPIFIVKNLDSSARYIPYGKYILLNSKFNINKAIKIRDENIKIRNKFANLASKRTFKKNLEKNYIIIPELIDKNEKLEIKIEKLKILEKNPKILTIKAEEMLKYLFKNETPQIEDPLGYPQQQFIPLALQKKPTIPPIFIVKKLNDADGVYNNNRNYILLGSYFHKLKNISDDKLSVLIHEMVHFWQFYCQSRGYKLYYKSEYEACFKQIEYLLDQKKPWAAISAVKYQNYLATTHSFNIDYHPYLFGYIDSLFTNEKKIPFPLDKKSVLPSLLHSLYYLKNLSLSSIFKTLFFKQKALPFSKKDITNWKPITIEQRHKEYKKIKKKIEY